jgi:hypothetical protein
MTRRQPATSCCSVPVVGDEVAPPDAEDRRRHLDREDGGEPRPLEAVTIAVQVGFRTRE